MSTADDMERGGERRDAHAPATPAPAAILPASLRRKLAWRLIVPIAAITFINSIDRVNVSYAGHAMSADVGLTPQTFGFGVSMFFIAYLLFQYPHAVLLRMIGIRPWIFVSMLVWGASGLMMAQVETPTQFYTARFLLGVAEAGFAPGMTWYISRWAPRSWRATAMAGALSAVPLSMVLGGPLCGWLLGLHANPSGLTAWRFMFLVQAIPNFLFAFVALWWFVDRPGRARWLSDGERETLAAAMRADEGDAPPRAPFAALARDPWVWRCCLTWLLVMTGSYALVFWLPQLVRQLDVGASEFGIGTISALPLLGMAIGLILNGRRSDRTGERLWHVGVPAAAAGVAMMIAAALPAGWLVLALLVVAGLGIGAAQGVFWTVPAAVNIGGGVVPVGVIALISMFGTAGGIVGPWLTGAVVGQTASFAPAIALLAALLILALPVLVIGSRGAAARAPLERRT